jgi:hypothetical protein
MARSPELNTFGHETQRLEASGLIAQGQAIVLYSVNFLCGAGGGGVVTWYDAPDATDAATRRGGLTGSAVSVWDYATGFRQRLEQGYLDLDVNVAEVIVGFRRR